MEWTVNIANFWLLGCLNPNCNHRVPLFAKHAEEKEFFNFPKLPRTILPALVSLPQSKSSAVVLKWFGGNRTSASGCFPQRPQFGETRWLQPHKFTLAGAQANLRRSCIIGAVIRMVRKSDSVATAGCPVPPLVLGNGNPGQSQVGNPNQWFLCTTANDLGFDKTIYATQLCGSDFYSTSNMNAKR